jgi:hypothetical protein
LELPVNPAERGIFMWQTFISTVEPTVVTALVTVCVAVVTAGGNALVKFINQKIAALQVKIGADTYNQNLTVAKNIWNTVDEYFRITPNVTKTVEAAQAKFAELIQKALPGVTDDEIEQLRQAVAGEVNKGKAALTAQAESTSGGTAAADTATAKTITVALEALQSAVKLLSEATADTGTDSTSSTASTDKTSAA